MQPEDNSSLVSLYIRLSIRAKNDENNYLSSHHRGLWRNSVFYIVHRVFTTSSASTDVTQNCTAPAHKAAVAYGVVRPV